MPPTPYATFTFEVSRLVKQVLNGEKMKPGFHQKVAGYLHKVAKKSPTLENVKDAIAYLNAHPEYSREHQEKLSAKNSVASETEDEVKEKKTKGRPKKTNVEAEAEESRHFEKTPYFTQQTDYKNNNTEKISLKSNLRSEEMNKQDKLQEEEDRACTEAVEKLRYERAKKEALTEGGKTKRVNKKSRKTRKTKKNRINICQFYSI